MLKPFFLLVLDVKTLFEKVASFTPYIYPLYLPLLFTPYIFPRLNLPHYMLFPVLSYSGMLLALINSMDLLLVIRRYY